MQTNRLALACILSCALSCAPKEQQQQRDPVIHTEARTTVIDVVFDTPAGPVRARAELADTQEARRVGLMHRRQLDVDAGMLFVFPTEDRHTFWMKNTLISLDMIFINNAHVVVGIVHRATPHSTEPRGVDRPSRYVLEMSGGWAAKRGIRAGTPVRMPSMKR